jgi:phenylpropionate dioxygenase-like ring-hydroxylating dioxygenase large terminal subunit
VTAPAPDDLFDPAHYRGVRRPVAEAETLPAWCYTSPEFHARELDRIFRAGWHFVGRADEMAEPGAYLAVDTAAGPLVLIREGTGRVGAFANTCRHRGARLLEGRGCRRRARPAPARLVPSGG